MRSKWWGVVPRIELAACKTLANAKKSNLARVVNNVDPTSPLVAEAQDLFALQREPADRGWPKSGCFASRARACPERPLRRKPPSAQAPLRLALAHEGGRHATARVSGGLDPTGELVDLARREFGAEHEVTARLAADLTRALYLAGASADDLLEAEALRRESLTGSEAVLDASHEEYVRREELVAAAREVGWEPFSCEEIRAVTLER